MKKLLLFTFSFILIVNIIKPASSGEDFTLILLPDTQYESFFYPTSFNSQTQWIVNNKTVQNIIFVTHVGDIVDIASISDQWKNTDAAMDKLDAGNVAYSVGPGNHDMGTGSLYEDYFGISRFSGKSWYGGSYSSDNYNNYSLFSGSGMDFIIINLQYYPTAEMLDWADGLLKANPNRRAIVESHDILKKDNAWQNHYIYTALKDNPNLFLMVCGHDYSLTDGAAYRAELGDDGHTIHIMLADYQGFDFFNQGGYLRILRFSPEYDKIYVTTYSPYLNKYITSYPDKMDIAFDMPFPVPVELITFNAKAEGKNVILIWGTATEVNNYGFEIERSLNPSQKEGILSWEKIGFIQGYGNSNSPKEYSFIDKDVSSGKNFYRLKQIDNDGKYEYSKEVEVDFVLTKDYTLGQNYPNPFNPSTTIGFGIPVSPNPSERRALVTLKVFDILGNEVKTLVNKEMEAGYHSVDFDASDLPSGVYFYRIQAVPSSGSPNGKAGQVFIDTKKMILLK